MKWDRRDVDHSVELSGLRKSEVCSGAEANFRAASAVDIHCVEIRPCDVSVYSISGNILLVGLVGLGDEAEVRVVGYDFSFECFGVDISVSDDVGVIISV